MPRTQPSRGRVNCWTLGALGLGGVGGGVGVTPGQTSWLAPSEWPGAPRAGMGAPLTGHRGPGSRGGCGSRQGRRPPSKGLSQSRTNSPHCTREQRRLRVTPWEDEQQNYCSVSDSFSKRRPRARRWASHWAKADNGQDRGLGWGCLGTEAARPPAGCLAARTASCVEARGPSPRLEVWEQVAGESVSGRAGPRASESPQGSQCRGRGQGCLLAACITWPWLCCGRGHASELATAGHTVSSCIWPFRTRRL